MSSTLDATLRRINRQTEEQAAEQLAANTGLSYAKLDDYPFSLEALGMLQLDVAKEKLFAPYVRSGTKVRFAIVHPENQLVLDEITLLGREWQLETELTVVSVSSFDYLTTCYANLLKEEAQVRQAELEAARQLADHDYFNKIKSLDDLREEMNRVSVTDIIEAIIAAAYNQGASDIHLEPGETSVQVRFRIDGVLQRVIELPLKHHHQIISRIKMMASVKLDQQSQSQDGRFSMADKGIEADFRVSIVPTGYGPGVVMRILKQSTEALHIEKLGFSAHNFALVQKSIKRPYGLILVTGPTGSGKSTTLYSILGALNSSEKKILTLEDPIEYRLAGVQQSQVDPEKGYGFAEGLKGALRQDPDIVMVGEIRDPETATIALNASLTGHLVLSTLHTNDAVTAHTRFLELGVAPFLLSGSIQAIIAQRLVRKLIPGSDPANPQYKGRIIISEVLCPNQQFEQAVLQKLDQESLRGLAVAGGMVPMVQDGLEKVRQGLTTEQEVYRVTAE
ncbi:type II secretion system ATPase GspE [soil metagenome]